MEVVSYNFVSIPLPPPLISMQGTLGLSAKESNSGSNDRPFAGQLKCDAQLRSPVTDIQKSLTMKT